MLSLYIVENGHYALHLETSDEETIDAKTWDFYKNEIVEIDARNSKLKELPELPVLHRTSSAKPTRDKKGNLVYKSTHDDTNYSYNPMVCVRKLIVSGTPIQKLPALPHGLEELYAEDCENLTELPRLPKTLKTLVIPGTQIKKLPKLPEGLTRLDVDGCPVLFLPLLPRGLKVLNISDCPRLLVPRIVSHISLPDDDDMDIPNIYIRFQWHDNGMVATYEVNEPVEEYIERSNALWYTIHHTRRMKESLVAKVFHPSRVEKWLEAGGFHTIEMMF